MLASLVEALAGSLEGPWQWAAAWRTSRKDLTVCQEDLDLQGRESHPTRIPSSLVIEGPARVQIASFPLFSAIPALQTETGLSECDTSLECLLPQQKPLNFCILAPGLYRVFVQIRERYPLLWVGAALGWGSRLWSRVGFCPGSPHLGGFSMLSTSLPHWSW